MNEILEDLYDNSENSQTNLNDNSVEFVKT